MDNNAVIKVENISKIFSLSQSAKNENNISSGYLNALKSVSFEIKRGESVGIVGPNGSGKSTLLKILSGITKPSSGRIEIRGKVAAILDIGAGFHQELSGRDNVFLNGQIHGFTKNDIRKKFDEIVEFSGISEFIDEPVKHYSNGMYLRLAFSVMAHLEFDVYLLDEVLSVGDSAFKTKCFAKIAELKSDNAKSFLVISHQPGEIAKTCQRAFFLNDGILSKSMTVEEALLSYSNSGEATTVKFPDFVRQAKVYFQNTLGKTINEFVNTEQVKIVVENSFHAEKGNIKIAIRVIDKLNNVVFNASPVLTKNGLQEINFYDIYKLSAKIPAFLLNTGFYSVDLVYYNNEMITGEIKKAGMFTVKLSNDFRNMNLTGESGPLKPYLEWDIQ